MHMNPPKPGKPPPNSFSSGANSTVIAGSSGADTQDLVGELQLAKKPSEAQNLLSALNTDDSQNTVSTRPTSTSNENDDPMTGRCDAESWDPEASIPAAHQLRAVSAGDYFSLSLACSCLLHHSHFNVGRLYRVATLRNNVNDLLRTLMIKNLIEYF